MAHPLPPSDPTDDDHAAWRPTPPSSVADRLGDLRDRLPTSPLRSLGLVAAVVLAAGVGWWLLRPPPPPIETALPLATGSSEASVPPGGSSPAAAAGPATTVASVELVVQSAGAVVTPGVYRLPAGARVDDLVAASGGLADDADGDRVNLAAPLGDGQRLWFPRRGEEEPPDVVAGEGGGSGTPAGPDGSPAPDATPVVVNLNSATAAELDALPGVGPATAAAILAYREEHGPFGAVDDLLEVRGIGDAKLEQIRPLATV